MSKYTCLLFIYIFLCSCQNRDTMKICISEMMSEKVHIPYDSMIYVSFKEETDKLTYLKNVQRCKYKYIMYVSKERCSTCIMDKLALWNEMLGLSKQNKLQIIFIISSDKEKIEDVRNSFYKSGLEYPIMIDTCNIFTRHNPHIPQNHVYHTLLLNSNDSIKLVGDPIHNEKIHALMNKIVVSKSLNE